MICILVESEISLYTTHVATDDGYCSLAQR